MEHIAANIKNASELLSKPPAGSWREMVTKALAKCALNYRVELSDADYRVYIEKLWHIKESSRIVRAIDLCIEKCDFMPKIKDILANMPDRESHNPKLPDVVVKTWREPFTSTSDVEYEQFENGNKQVRVVPRSAR